MVRQVLEHFFAKYDLESPLRLYLLRQEERLQAEKEAVQRELDPTLSLKEALDRQVRSFTSDMTHLRCAQFEVQRLGLRLAWHLR